MTDAPLVTAVIPSFNSGWCLPNALESVLAQSYAPLDIIVVDDGGEDDLAGILAPYGDRARLVRQEHAGLSAARNTGVRHARGDYVAFLDADDAWLPEKIAAQMALMIRRPELGFCSTNTRIENDAGDLLHHWSCVDPGPSLLETLFWNNAAIAGSGSSVLGKKTLFERAGLFDVSLSSCEDLDMWMRLAPIAPYQCLAEPLAVVRRHEGPRMSHNHAVMRRSALSVLKKNRHLLPSAKRGGFWRGCYANTLIAFSKWAYRAGERPLAFRLLAEAFLRAPFGPGRWALGVAWEIVRNRPL